MSINDITRDQFKVIWWLIMTFVTDLPPGIELINDDSNMTEVSVL